MLRLSCVCVCVRVYMCLACFGRAPFWRLLFVAVTMHFAFICVLRVSVRLPVSLSLSVCLFLEGPLHFSWPLKKLSP